ncbi:MAG: hypothetical protein KUG81_02470 [Gammaproteobacteria bacterium]|nr:hypothetical protein [Gammaproteobacteria bacterium]
MKNTYPIEITYSLLDGASLYLSKITYKSKLRELTLVAVDNPTNQTDVKKIIFPEITEYSEVVEDLDDDLLESTLGIDWVENKKICVKTDAREIILTLNGQPYSEKM